MIRDSLERIASPRQLDRAAATGMLRGGRDAVSLLLGFFPLGVAFGMAARQVGFSALEASLMSLIVFAGASQFIGIALIAAGAGVLEVAATTFLVNLRHALMSASLAVHLQGVSRGLLSVLAFGITDETFGLSVSRFAAGQADRWYLLGANFVCYVAWNSGTLAGHLAGELLPGAVRNAMAFALPAVFISLLVMSCRDRAALLVVGFSSALSAGLFLTGIDTGNVVLVGVAGATVGFLVRRWMGR